MIIGEIKSLANIGRAHELQQFFQTGPGQYGEGDVFLGLTVPQVRQIASKFKALSMPELQKLLDSPFHEVRMCGLVIISNRYKRIISRGEKKILYDFFLKNIEIGNINNWDLIDVHGATIGEYLIEISDPLKVLSKLAKSNSLWERRVSIIFTFAFIRVNQLDLTISVSKLLINDEHDLIQKAVGWALREVGKKDVFLLRKFLADNACSMPRTMLRYAIEKLPEPERKKWLNSTRG